MIQPMLVLLFTLIVHAEINCIQQPWEKSCKDFKIADDVLRDNNENLCGMMYMPGCTIRDVCEDQKNVKLYPEFCTPFAVFKMLCVDMPGMGPCKSYKSMCMNDTSVVDQCEQQIVPLPSTSQLAGDIKAICESMNMDGCDKCQDGSKCDGLKVYSGLCLAMDMKECADWKDMCKEIPNWSLCGANNPIPGMVMYFHTGITEYILFKGWVPQNETQYIIVVIIIFVSSIVYELLKFFRWKMERGIAAQGEKESLMVKHHHHHVQESVSPKGWTCSTSLIRAIFHFLEVLAGSVLMLLLMTYNIPIFFSIVLGRAVGSFIVGNRMDNSGSQTVTAECH